MSFERCGILVVIPAYNEAAGIGGLVRRVAAAGFPVLVVDDGSSDGTADAARKAGADVLRLESNRGKGAALRAAFERALQTSSSAVITMDADGQHDPEDLAGFVEALERRPEALFIGDRMSAGSGMPRVRRLTNRVMSRLLSLLTGQRVLDSQCGFRAIRREALSEMRLESERYEIESEMILEAARAGRSIGSVPVRCIYRGEKSRIRPGRDTWRFFSFLAAYRKRRDGRRV